MDMGSLQVGRTRWQGYLKVHTGAPHRANYLTLPYVAGGQACGVWLNTNGNF